MSKSSPISNQKTKKDYKKWPVNGVQIYPKKKEKKNKSMALNDLKIFLKIKRKRWLSVEKFLLKN